jgi:NAD+ kinase
MTFTTSSGIEMPPIRSAAVLLHPRIPEAERVSEEVCAALESCTLSISRSSVWDVTQIREILPHVDVAITLGGDGSILRAARIAVLSDTPVLGINLGTLGFLAEIEPADVATRIPPLVRGHYWLERRIMIQAEHRRGDEVLGTHQALNEVVVGRRALSRVVRVATRLNDQELTTYTADGVLVGTPTGSTAYAHAAGGPILHPEVQSLLLTPICAHPNPSGSLVMPANTVVTLTVRTDHEAALSIDGQEDVSMVDGDSVAVRVSPYTARFLRSQQRDYFYHTLLKKLRW